MLEKANLPYVGKFKSGLPEIKPYSISELSVIYQVDPRTLANWIQPFNDELGKRIGRFYTVRQVEIIITRLGLPYCFDEIESRA